MHDHRSEAQAALKLAQKMDVVSTAFTTNLANYKNCAEIILQIEHKIDSDYRSLESVYARLAIFHFNRFTNEHRQLSRDNYINAINALLKLENPTDADFRKFVQHYIDLADIFLYLYDKTQSEEAISNAIEAFKCIQKKTKAENKLGDPKTNITAFITHFEKKTASKNYINSAPFKNNSAILVESIDEKNVLQSFGNINLDEEKKLQQSLVDMIESMSIQVVNTSRLFSNFSKNSPEDAGRRTLAKQYLAFTQKQLEKKMFSDALKTYKQSLNALKQIEQKNSEDTKYIEAIEEQIKQVRRLQTKTKKRVETQNTFSFSQHNGAQIHLISHSNLFENQEAQASTSDPIADIEDIGMNVEY